MASSSREHAEDPTDVHLVMVEGARGVEYRGPYASLPPARGVVTRLTRQGYRGARILRATEWEVVE